MFIEMTPIQEAYALLSDVHKDAYGFRPRNYRNDLTLDEINEEIDRLLVIASENEKAERILEISNKADFEALIERTIGLGAGDRKTALRWLYEANEGYEACHYDIEFYVWNLGIGCGDIAKPLVNEIYEALKKVA